MTHAPQYQEFWPGAEAHAPHHAHMQSRTRFLWDGKTILLATMFLMIFAGFTSLATIMVMQELHPERFAQRFTQTHPDPTATQRKPVRLANINLPPPPRHHNTDTNPLARRLLGETLQQLSLANFTNTYSQFHNLASPAFQRANSAQKLRDVFAWMRKRQISLSTEDGLRSFALRNMLIDKNGFLNVSGLVDTQPIGLTVNVAYQKTSSAWKLFGIQVALQR